MDHTPDLDAVADAVMAAHAVIEQHGTHEMKTMSRVLLFAVGKEIAQRGGLASEPHDLHGDEIGRSREQTEAMG